MMVRLGLASPIFLSDTLSLKKQTVSVSGCRSRVPQPWP